MNYNIRPAVEDDLSALLALYYAYHEDLTAFGMNYDINHEQVERVLSVRIRSKLILTLVAEDENGALVGFVFCSILRLSNEYLCEGSSSIGYINDLYVAPQARRVHLADRLYSAAEDWLRENGIPACEYQIFHSNEACRSLVSAHGPKPIGTLYYKVL